MKILRNIYLEMLNKFPVPPPEQGGILGMKNGVICEYYHDDYSSVTDRAVYEPDVNVLNQIIEEWYENDIQFAGVIHSHLIGQNTLSSGDKDYIKKLFKSMPECIDELYFPIIIPETKNVISFVGKRKTTDVTIKSDIIYLT